MAREYIQISPENNLGVVALMTSIFQDITANVVAEDKNVALADPKNFKTPLQVKIVDNKLVIQLELKVKYGVNVQEACQQLQAKIFDSIEHMCDYTPDYIDLKVTGFIFE